MKLTRGFVIVFCLVCSNKWAGNCVRDVIVNIKDKEENSFYSLEHLGPSYGTLPTVMYKMKPGFLCKQLVTQLYCLWEAKGEERAYEILVSGHGGPRKRVEIHLTNGETLFFQKEGRVIGWIMTEPRSNYE